MTKPRRIPIFGASYYLIYINLVSKKIVMMGVEHLFIGLLTICVYFSINYLFMSFTQFSLGVESFSY